MRIHQNHWQLACFDLDGTLVLGTSTCEHLAAKLGHYEKLSIFETRYANGEISNSDVADGDAPHYKGQTLDSIARHLDDIPIISGVPSTVAALSDLGIDSLLCTITWKFAAETFAARYGFVDVSGTEMHVNSEGFLSGRVSKYFDEFDKLAFVKTYCERREILLSRVFAVGDSRSDIPLFGAVGFSVALNATPSAQAAASMSIQTKNLVDVLSVIPGLLSTR